MPAAGRWIVSGRVQGVGFRAFVVRVARQMELTGYVRNAVDGTVEIWAEGPQEALDRLVLEVRRGPSRSEVTSVERFSVRATGSFDGFDVRW